MLIEIKGAQFVNKGAALMLRAVMERLRADLPGVEFALTPGPNAPFHVVAGAGAWQRLRLPGAPFDADAACYRLPGRIRAVARRYGIVTEPDVAAVLDASGFAYGAAWGDAALDATATEIERLARHGKPYVFLPQAFGPFADSQATERFGRALRHASLVCARDEESRSHLARIAGDLGPALDVYPDFTLSLRGDPAAAARWRVDRGTALLIPNAEMTGERAPHAAWRSGYLPLLEALARRLRELGFDPRVLNHEGAADASLCEKLRAAVGAEAVIAEDDPIALKGIAGAAGLVVSSRYHGCAAALSQGVPCLATAWSHKYAALFSDFGVAQYVIESCDGTDALRRLEALAAHRAAVAAELDARRAALVTRTAVMWQRVRAALLDARGS